MPRRNRLPKTERMKTTLRYIGVYLGFLVGLICAFVSLLMFSIIESVRMVFLVDEPISFGAAFSLVFPLILIYGGIFSFIPSGIGGYVLELLVRARLKKGSLAENWAVIFGISLAGLAALITCGIGLFVMAVIPHNGWRELLDGINSGLLYSNLPYYIGGFTKQASHLFPEISIATVLACVSGGFAGKYLARVIKGTQVETG